MTVTVLLYRGSKLIRRISGQGRKKNQKIYAAMASSPGKLRYVIKVSYGMHKTVFGTVEEFTNEYDGTDKENAKKALVAFLEDA